MKGPNTLSALKKFIVVGTASILYSTMLALPSANATPGSDFTTAYSATTGTLLTESLWMGIVNNVATLLDKVDTIFTSGNKLKVPTSTETCDGTINGAIRSTGSTIEFCDGANWSALGGGANVEVLGGTISFITGYTVHTFTTDGTLIVSGGNKNVEYLVVGGGGGGASSNGVGGGGAGGYLEGGLSLAPGSYPITVGTGGAANTAGGNSIFSSITAQGGGRGGVMNMVGGDGGSGGGGGASSGAGGSNLGGTATPSPVQGNNGGEGKNDGANGAFGGGGGGAFSGGSNGAFATGGGDGGTGKVSDISGTSIKYSSGGGGGGDSRSPSDTTGGAGGRTSGGNSGDGGGASSINGVAGAPNRGEGGGGGGYNGSAGTGGAGGAGIVIVRYLN